MAAEPPSEIPLQLFDDELPERRVVGVAGPVRGVGEVAAERLVAGEPSGEPLHEVEPGGREDAAAQVQAAGAVRIVAGRGAGVVPPPPRDVEDVTRLQHPAPHRLPGRLHGRLRIAGEREAAGLAVQMPAFCAGDLQDEHVVVVPVRGKAAGRRPGGIEVDPGVATQGLIECIGQRADGGMDLLETGHDDGGALAEEGRQPPVVEQAFVRASPSRSPSMAEVRRGVVVLGDRLAVPDEVHPALPSGGGQQPVERVPGAQGGEARPLRPEQDRTLVPVAGVEELLRGKGPDDAVEPGRRGRRPALAGDEHLDGGDSAGLDSRRIRFPAGGGRRFGLNHASCPVFPRASRVEAPPRQGPGRSRC